MGEPLEENRDSRREAKYERRLEVGGEKEGARTAQSWK